MKEHIYQLLLKAFETLQAKKLIATDIDIDIRLEIARDPQHGDYVSNLALMLAPLLKQPPQALAKMVVAHLPSSSKLATVEVAGAGFINFTITPKARQSIVVDILAKGRAFGHSTFGKGQKLHIEFISANPTGPLHVGHGRHGAYGMSVANLLSAMGYEVHREYYINDAGRQMAILALSLWFRYLQQQGEKIDFPKKAYQGDYITAIAKQLLAQYHQRWYQPASVIFNQTVTMKMADQEVYLDALITRARQLLGDQFEALYKLGLAVILSDIRQDLHQFRVEYQQWFSEQQLLTQGEVKRALDILEAKQCLYQKQGATWFKSTQFGDKKDWVVIRENGQYTYFASDIAYHLHKLARGFDRIINVWGADHHGYLPRISHALHALSGSDQALQVALVQFVALYRHGKKISMSTRDGTFVTLKALIDEVGCDAARFFYVMRKETQTMDFDLALASAQSNDNPVYYIQYAHARICSVFRQLSQKHLAFDQSHGLKTLAALTSHYEMQLLRQLHSYPDIIHQAATRLEPHLLANYLQRLANDFHSYYNAIPFLRDDKRRDARLCLIAAVQQVIVNGFGLLDISTPEQM